MQNPNFVDLVNDILKDADKKEHFFQVSVIVLFIMLRNNTLGTTEVLK